MSRSARLVPVVIAILSAAVHAQDEPAPYLEDPFENEPTDTAMTICRTIEINLCEQLGETELPEKLEPEDGVLM